MCRYIFDVAATNVHPPLTLDYMYTIVDVSPFPMVGHPSALACIVLPTCSLAVPSGGPCFNIFMPKPLYARLSLPPHFMFLSFLERLLGDDRQYKASRQRA